MVGTVSLKTEEDFKKMIEFLAEKYCGFKGSIYEVLGECGFEGTFKEEYKHMELSNIIDRGYDEADDEEYSNWIPFKDVDPKTVDFFLGDYYINFTSTWDRGGDVVSRWFMKLETPELTGREFITKYHTAMNKRAPIAQAMDNLQMAIRAKDSELMEKAKISDEEWDTYKALNKELQEMGML